MYEVFRSLADPSRRQLLDKLFAHNGQTLGQLVEGMQMSRQGVMKHLHQLEAANLVSTVRVGREKLHYLNPVPIVEIQDRWIGKYETHRLRAITDLKKGLSQK